MTTRALRALSTIVVVLLLAISTSGQTPDFTGHWREQINSKTQLEIEQKGRKLRVTTVVTNSSGPRNLEVNYVIGGSKTNYKGLDGDEFHTSVRWDANSLVFDTIEVENSNKIPQKAVWILSADGKSIQVSREITKYGRTSHSSTTYIREP